ncbi:hypothetical protein ARMGADRAFT_1009451 [Armillaria gallica]|uniref:Uncharacterized protein n=1 Tax=Armillaria gallica TaxID=47427 RepID=A0A2H3ED16_ARMGA|nr:hypothetical protein ARMGADRAFT_1009451 [Armillaria gallica]
MADMEHDTYTEPVSMHPPTVSSYGRNDLDGAHVDGSSATSFNHVANPGMASHTPALELATTGRAETAGLPGMQNHQTVGTTLSDQPPRICLSLLQASTMVRGLPYLQAPPNVDAKGPSAMRKSRKDCLQGYRSHRHGNQQLGQGHRLHRQCCAR